MAFYVGQKVVCVDAEDCPQTHPHVMEWDGLIHRGGVYTIRSVGEADHPFGRYLGVRLQGITRRDIFDTPYHARRFRPVVEKKTDTSIFTALLNPANHLEGVS